MNRRYYLRGLGMGILVTAVILTISFQNRKTLSDEEIIKRAKELGMVESTYLSEIANSQNKPEESKEEVKEPETLEVVESKEEPEGSNVEESSEERESSEIEESSKEPEPAEVEESTEPSLPEETTGDSTDSGNSVEITVSRGDSSTTVAKKLEELGVITDYKEFDRFLAKNGNDKRIKAKSYTISKDATWEEIAEIITK